LNLAERQAARASFTSQGGRRGPGGPGGGFRGAGADREAPQPGPRLSPADVSPILDAPVYDAQTLRTFFLEFESPDWEQELADFHNTDVEVPAQVTVDGRTYREVGVHFRGQSSFMMVSPGSKRSLNLAFDFVHPDQNLGGYRTFNLLNSHGDPTFLRAVLYHHIARTYLPAPQANFVRVVINGESWGVYVSLQQFNKDFVRDWFGTTKGARWKVPGSPNGQGGLAYLGTDVDAYRRIYEIKTKDDPKSWGPLIRLCEVLTHTPVDQLEAALAPLLDVDGALRFLALDNAFVNSDGYWTRASDYHLYLDPDGRFHLIPYDANETFSTGGGPGGPGGPGGFRGPGGSGGFAGRRGPGGPGFGGGPGGGGGVQLDPFVAATDASKPLLSKLLAVPALRERYLGYLRDLAETWLDWNRLGPLALHYQAVIAEAIQADTRKLDSTEAFFRGVVAEPASAENSGDFGRGPRGSLQAFAEQRRAFLLNHAEVRRIAGAPAPANRRPVASTANSRAGEGVNP
jgi:hypothetical protein